jgi:hypothetical protein
MGERWGSLDIVAPQHREMDHGCCSISLVWPKMDWDESTCMLP